MLGEILGSHGDEYEDRSTRLYITAPQKAAIFRVILVQTL
jgi:hypothetical protein